ncbi:uncharacterized protein LOC132725746 [Ruditapes philippinarum]|uniref:uncharacterized protein LOC132725746 n=1 Tax=Ruditapes philippinarum TaxID=129788 RepID=UPI00295A87DB|nr:uncharacterized protein LOC132725746 [Ruditapes philippinarum]
MSARSARITAYRLFFNIFRGEVNCISATCFLVVVFVFLSMVLNMKRAPTVMTSLEHAKLNWKELDRESENTILIEHEDENFFQSDDDVFLNVFKLMEDIESKFRNKKKQIWCPVRYKGTSLIQRKKGKWKVDENEFKNMTYFPVTYCNGFFTILTKDLIQEMYEAAKVTPFFWVDDVYLFGLLPDKIGNVKHNPLPNLNLNEKDAKTCFESRDKKCNLLVANAHSDGIMDKFWFSALEQYKTLAQKYSKDALFV